MTKRGIRRSSMNSSVPTIIVDARLASLTRTATTRTTSTSPTTRTNISDNGSSGTVSSLGSIAPDAHFMAALRLAADRKVLRAPGSSRRRPPVPWTASSFQASSRIDSRITTKRCLSREPACKHVCRHSNSPEVSGQQMTTRKAAATAVRVSRSKQRHSDVDNLDSKFTKNKDRHSSAAGGGKAIPDSDWPLLYAAAQEILTEMTQQSDIKPRLSDADLREAIQLLMKKRASEQQQQKGERPTQNQPPMPSRPRMRMTAQREVEMTCGFGDCVKDDESGGGGKKSGSLHLIVCIAMSGGATTQSLDEPVDKLSKLKADAKLKVELSHFEPSMVMEAAEENPDTPVHAKLDVVDDNDGLSLPGVELWRDSSSCVHNADVLEAQAALLTGNLGVATQEEPKPPQPKPPQPKPSNVLIGMSLRESMRSSIDHDRMRGMQRELTKEQRQQKTSSEEEKMRVLQQELMEEWKEQKALDFSDEAKDSDEDGFNSDGGEGVASSDKSSDDMDGIEGGIELNAKTNSMLSILSKDSAFFPKSNQAPVNFTQDDNLGEGIGPDGLALPAGFYGLSGLGNVEALMERRKELLQRLSKIQVPIVSCPAAVVDDLEDHSKRNELAKDVVMNLQLAEEHQVVVQAARSTWQNLNLKRPLRLNQYRRCGEDNDLDNRSDD